MDSARDPEPTSTLSFSEALKHYFEMRNELYERKVRGDDGEMTQGIQQVVDALVAEMAKALDEKGDGEQFRAAIREEDKFERWSLWVRRTANRLKASRPGLLSLELLGSAGVVIAVAYYIVRVDVGVALLVGAVLIGLRLSLPRFMLRLAAQQERKLRKLRRLEEQQP